MRKLLSWMLAMIMLCANTGAFAMGVGSEEVEEEEHLPTLYAVETVEDLIGFQPGTEITIGVTTELAGYFATDMWGNNAADMDVRALLHGYSTVAWIRTLGMALDGTPIDDIVIDDNLPGGGRKYTFNLNRNLVYNDGSPLTAKDYLFSLLLSCSSPIGEIGGMARDFDHIAGYAAYREGREKGMSGLRLIDDYTFSMEILPQYLPYFYGLAMLNITPYPMAVIAPGCDILDDGAGAYLDGDFTADLLRETLLNPQTGYLSNPKVTSGPYQLESYDAEQHTAVFTVNPNYLGNFEGKKPSIEKITLVALKNTDIPERMASGEVSIAHKVVDQQAYLNLVTLVQEGQIARPRNYLRSGFAYLSFACEQGPTASVAVRNAIAQCIDKQAFVDSTFVRGLAVPVYGYYGLGQWLLNGTVEVGDESLTISQALEEGSKPADILNAKALLVADGWTLNEAGEAFVEGTDAIRYRQGEAGLEALNIKWAKIANSAAADSIRNTIEAPFQELGIGLEVTEMSLSEMLPYYYRQVDRTYDMFNLASNFTYVFDPYYDFNVGEDYQGLVNASGLQDESLMNLAWDLRRTEARDAESYQKKWLTFQEKWMELMPMVPLYSNVYFDFAAKNVQNYNVENFSTWSLAILYTYIQDEPVETEDVTAESI